MHLHLNDNTNLQLTTKYVNTNNFCKPTESGCDFIDILHIFTWMLRAKIRSDLSTFSKKKKKLDLAQFINISTNEATITSLVLEIVQWGGTHINVHQYI